ncbi:MAG: pyridoxal kinase [Alphaproteobacteria bacterium]|nr:pyridoxal kinase [Alphaproteobacteria bacterium]
MRILCVSSQVAYGPVGNSAAVPALQARGHEVLALPTIVLSNHPGHGRPAVLRTAAADLAAMLGVLEDLGALDGCGAVMTGYFAANDQIHGVARIIRRMKSRNPGLFVLVDPILGDHDALYVPLPVAEGLRDELLPLASCVTPNRFELEWLTGWRAASVREAEAASRRLPAPEVLATSIPGGSGQLATLVTTETGTHIQTAALREMVPHGTGDFLAGLYLARRADGVAMAQSLAQSMAILERAIAHSAGSPVLDVAGALQT